MVSSNHDAAIIDKILNDLKANWNIEVSREMIAQQAENMNRKLQIMHDIRTMQKNQFPQGHGMSVNIQEKQRQLKSQLVDLSIEDNKIVLERLAEL
jgi:proteasome assembly chaperone (PAC2) family protein